MIATRTLPSSRRALPFVDAIRASGDEKLLADEEDALHHGDPGREREEIDGRFEQPDAERGEHETGGDHGDALRSRPDADVTAEADRLGPGARVADEERARDSSHRECERHGVVVPREDEPNRAEHRALAE